MITNRMRDSFWFAFMGNKCDFNSFHFPNYTIRKERKRRKKTVGNKNTDEIIKWSRVTPSVFNGITFSCCYVAVNRFQYTYIHIYIRTQTVRWRIFILHKISAHGDKYKSFAKIALEMLSDA